MARREVNVLHLREAPITVPSQPKQARNLKASSPKWRPATLNCMTMANIHSTSIAAIQATASPASTKRATTVGVMIRIEAIAPEVMVEQANMAMLKLTGILKAKDKA